MRERNVRRAARALLIVATLVLVGAGAVACAEAPEQPSAVGVAPPAGNPAAGGPQGLPGPAAPGTDPAEGTDPADATDSADADATDDGGSGVGGWFAALVGVLGALVIGYVAGRAVRPAAAGPRVPGPAPTGPPTAPAPPVPAGASAPAGPSVPSVPSALSAPSAPVVPSVLTVPDGERLAHDRDELVRTCITVRDMVTVAALSERLAETLREVGVVEVRPDGETFDPQRHRAVEGIAPVEPGGEGRVARTERVGYRDGDRLLRPPEVVVYETSEPGPHA